MPINAYTTGTNQTLNTNNVFVKPDIADGDMLFWNSQLNLFESGSASSLLTRADLEDYATKPYVQQEVLNAGSGGSVNLSEYATVDFVEEQIQNIGDHFSGSWNDLTDKPTLFSGSFNDLVDTPTFFSGDYNDLINSPNLSNYHQTLSLVGTVLYISDGNSVNLASLNTGSSSVDAGIELTDLSVLQFGAEGGSQLTYDQNTGVFSYTPPDLSAYAIQTDVTSQISSAVTGLASQNYVYTQIQNAINDIQLSDLTDVSGATPQVGYVLKWEGTRWIAAPDAQASGGSGGISLTSISAITESQPSGSGLLTYNDSTGIFSYTPPDLSSYSTFDGDYNNLDNLPTLPTSINDLSDVQTSGQNHNPSDGDVLAWDGSMNHWMPTSPQSGGTGGSTSPLGWESSGTDNQYRVTDTFTENGQEFSVRNVTINGDGKLQLELASFSPVVSATGQSLYWDQPATQFTVNVDNPTDFTSQYIESVSSITYATGVHTVLNDYTTSGPSQTPDGGVDWSQTFTTNSTATILSNGSGLSGGNATATITWQDNNSDDWTDTENIQYNWQNANATVSFASLTGKNFLQSYSSVNYTVNITGIQTASNASTTLTPTGGSLSNASSSGSMSFTEPLHKDNNSGRRIDLSTDFNRPATITGSAYTATDTSYDSTINASFTYPSFYIWTVDVNSPPSRTDIVDNNDFHSDVTELGDQTNSIDTFINNTTSLPQAFWFGVRTSASQPNSFKTGPTSALLSDTSYTTGNSVQLTPDNPVAGYAAEDYTLYGITLQPGNTYVRIS